MYEGCYCCFLSFSQSCCGCVNWKIDKCTWYKFLNSYFCHIYMLKRVMKDQNRLIIIIIIDNIIIIRKVVVELSF